MTQKEIIEGNVLIAAFEGWEKREGFAYLYKKSGKQAAIDQFKYHTSWDWLMPVVEKIENTAYKNQILDVIISSNESHVVAIHQVNGVGVLAGGSETGSRLKNTWECCVQFIKWYNNQQQ